MSNVSNNQALQALRRSARKFMIDGELNQDTFTITLDSTQTVYQIPMPTDVFIKDIVDQPDSYTFNGIDTITFSSVTYETGDTLEVEAILGYDANSNSFPAWIINRYFDGIVAGAKAKLDPGNLRYHNNIYAKQLSEAMSYAGVFTGVKG
ncbi:MAG: hypothetical protein ACTSYA_05650 [Candidatus Kariarchaeaceae archaeon]